MKNYVSCIDIVDIVQMAHTHTYKKLAVWDRKWNTLKTISTNIVHKMSAFLVIQQHSGLTNEKQNR